MKMAKSLATLLVGTMLFGFGCSKGAPSQESSGAAQANSNANTNAGQRIDAPLTAKTIRGDLERAGMAITGARQDVRENNWDAAASLLRSASNSIGEALTKKPRVYTDFEDLKAAIDRTIKTVEAHEKDADNQIAYLETAIRALKVND
jgi:hypothetical protein